MTWTFLGFLGSFTDQFASATAGTVSPETAAQVFPRQAVFDTVVFDEASQCRLGPGGGGWASSLAVRPHATTLGAQPFLDTDYQQFLLSIDPYDPSEHEDFRGLIEEGQLRLEIRYESIYGGEGFTVIYPRRGLISSAPIEDRS